MMREFESNPIVLKKWSYLSHLPFEERCKIYNDWDAITKTCEHKWAYDATDNFRVCVKCVRTQRRGDIDKDHFFNSVWMLRRCWTYEPVAAKNWEIKEEQPPFKQPFKLLC